MHNLSAVSIPAMRAVLNPDMGFESGRLASRVLWAAVLRGPQFERALRACGGGGQRASVLRWQTRRFRIFLLSIRQCLRR